MEIASSLKLGECALQPYIRHSMFPATIPLKLRYILPTLVALVIPVSAQEQMKFLIDKDETYHRIIIAPEVHIFVADPATNITDIELQPGIALAAEFALDEALHRATWFLRPKLLAASHFLGAEAAVRFGRDLFGSAGCSFLYSFQKEKTLRLSENSKTIYSNREPLQNLYITLGLGFHFESLGLEGAYRFVADNTVTIEKTNINQGSPVYGRWRHAYLTLTFWIEL